MKEGVFWILLNVCLGLSVFMMFLFVHYIFTERSEFPRSGISANLKSLSDTVLPILSNVLFLPIVAVLIEVFMCTETTGDDLDDAFLDKDCHEQCWESTHNAYTALATIGLLIYTPISIFMRPKW
jgi:hypothetical protein